MRWDTCVASGSLKSVSYGTASPRARRPSRGLLQTARFAGAGGGRDDFFVGDKPGVGVGPDNVDRVGRDDVLQGGSGDDEMNADAGSDTLVGGDGVDALFTDDTIEDDSAGDDARDLVYGGGGDDFVDAEDGPGLAADVISCGADRDTVLADRADRPSWDCEVVR